MRKNENMNAEEYARDSAHTIDATGRVLERIGLVQRDGASLFGWKSTAVLRGIVVETRLRKQRPIKESGDLIYVAFLRLLLEAVDIPDDADEVTCRCCVYNVLEALHLIRKDAISGYVIHETLPWLLTKATHNWIEP